MRFPGRSGIPIPSRIWQSKPYHLSGKSGQVHPDAAYQVSTDPNSVHWIRSDFRVWNQWRTRSLKKLDDTVSYVVISDITGCYENIDIDRLLSDLRAISTNENIIGQLNRCLRLWAEPRGKGIPQGYSASDILAKVYFHPIDSYLRRHGLNHLRYVDDFRIFTKSMRAARIAIGQLSRAVHGRGLNLQSAKTLILDRIEARNAFDGVEPIIRNIQADLRTEVAELLGLEDPHISNAALTAMIGQTSASPPEVLERAFAEHFATSDPKEFDKTLFHYLLTRLGGAKSKAAVTYCIDAIATRPEETSQILRYFSAVGVSKTQLNTLVRYFHSRDAIFHYQLYEFVSWVLAEELENGALLKLCRERQFDGTSPAWLRGVVLNYVGRYGDKSDLEQIEAGFASITDEAERINFIFSLRNQEKSRRNSFLGRLPKHVLTEQAAARCVKAK